MPLAKATIAGQINSNEIGHEKGWCFMRVNRVGLFIRRSLRCLPLNMRYRLVSALLAILIICIPLSIDIRFGFQDSGYSLSQPSDSALIKALATLKWSVLLQYDLGEAGWIDDWISQRTESGPQYFEGQKRGYFTAGSFSARLNMSNDYLFSIQKPKLKSGCGGIDLFMGGFSFLNADYLVKKLQNIMTAAPAVAFSIALNTIAPEINQEMSKYSSMIDQLNNIQLNDCKAATTIATVAVDEAMGKGADANKALADFAQGSGLTDLYHTFTSDAKSNSGTSTITGAQNYLQGCSGDIQTLFSSSGFLLDKIAANYYSYLQTYVPTIRAYIGDVSIYVDTNTGIPKITYYPPICDQAFDVESFINGQMQIMNTTSNTPPTAACAAATDANANISQWVGVRIQSITDALKNHSQLFTSDQNFISVIPVPIYSALITSQAVDPNVTGSIGGPLQDTIARIYAYRITRDLMDASTNIAMKIKHMSRANQNGAYGQATYKCQLDLLQDLPSSINEMEKHAKYVLKSMDDSYKAAQASLETGLNVAERYRQYKDIIYQSVGNTFGRGAAIRALSR